MASIALHPQLMADTHTLGQYDGSALLLLRNSAYPWLVLVPDTDRIEMHHLPPDQQRQLWAQISTLAAFIEQHFAVDKINLGAIGNLVPQLHIHVLGRRKDDPAWPGVVWGAPAQGDYSEAAVVDLKAALTLAVTGFEASRDVG